MAQNVNPAPVKFGIDLFSIRSSGWTPFSIWTLQVEGSVVHFSGALHR